jgi:hypothetical protein
MYAIPAQYQREREGKPHYGANQHFPAIIIVLPDYSAE